jgi:hypothetical protein
LSPVSPTYYKNNVQLPTVSDHSSTGITVTVTVTVTRLKGPVMRYPVSLFPTLFRIRVL